MAELSWRHGAKDTEKVANIHKVGHQTAPCPCPPDCLAESPPILLTPFEGHPPESVGFQARSDRPGIIQYHLHHPQVCSWSWQAILENSQVPSHPLPSTTSAWDWNIWIYQNHSKSWYIWRRKQLLSPSCKCSWVVASSKAAWRAFSWWSWSPIRFCRLSSFVWVAYQAKRSTASKICLRSASHYDLI